MVLEVVLVVLEVVVQLLLLQLPLLQLRVLLKLPFPLGGGFYFPPAARCPTRGCVGGMFFGWVFKLLL